MAEMVAPDEHGMVPDRRQAARRPLPSRVVSRPVPQAQIEDPREYQLGQMRRRYSPKESRQPASEFHGIEDGTTLLTFKLKPSDPDFPFEMTTLECSLSVPPGYPITRPKLNVGNKDIPRGFAINVENGFAELAEGKPQSTLLELMNALDKNLETFLSRQKAETVKIVLPARPLDVSKLQATHPAPVTSKPVETFTDAQQVDASKQREVETRQLEARMGRLPLYKKSSDGIAHTLPLEPRKRSDLPTALQAIKTVVLFVPLLYPLQPCRIRLEGFAPDDSMAVEKAFELRAQARPDMTLMSHINYLAQNMHTLARTSLESEKKPEQIPEPAAPEASHATHSSKGKAVVVPEDLEESDAPSFARPPEWTMINADDAEDSESDDIDSYDTEDESSEDADDDGGVQLSSQYQTNPAQNPERGTAISFPFIELYGIEVLEVVTLNLTVKCERCKEVNEIKGLKTGVPKSERCKKCTTMLGITYRRDLVHINSVRAGFLDLVGCIIVDMLPR